MLPAKMLEMKRRLLTFATPERALWRTFL
jgi:hypothetical protein